MFSQTGQDRPIPAAIDGRPWTVHRIDAGGGTDVRRAVMQVETADTPTARLIRIHELAHARATPRVTPDDEARKGGVTLEALQWSEDARIGAFGALHGLWPEDGMTDADCDRLVAARKGDERALAGALLACSDMPEPIVDRLCGAMERAGVPRSWIGAARDAVADMVDGAWCGAAPRRGRAGRSGSRHRVVERSKERYSGEHDGFRRFTLPLARLFDAAFPPGGGAPRGGKTLPPEALRRIRSWPKLLDVREPARTETVRRRRAPARRWSDCGAVPLGWHRLPSDGTVFGTRRRARGGTILCDASGSMEYSDDDLRRIMTIAPAATVAFYSGATHGGYLVVAVRDGRAASLRSVRDGLERLGGNCVDLPALQWLARQPAPRFWVTDEEVGCSSTVGFGKGSLSWQECRAAATAAGVTIVETIDRIR